jgi:capsular exopolysaccharide synthesis family protein
MSDHPDLEEMSTLLPRSADPSAPAAGDSRPTAADPISQPLNDDGALNLRELLRALRRRKRLVVVTAAAVLVGAGLFTTYQRIFKPVYSGGFQLLISDPVSEDSSGGRRQEQASGSAFEMLALNSTRSDLPTLFEVLKSPMLLQPIARQFGGSLPGSIEINSGGSQRGGSQRNVAQGVLTVGVTGRDPEKLLRLQQALAKAYLAYSLSQRQQRLAEGLRFLDRQSPALQAKTDKIQSELATFRRRHNLLEPKEEGLALKTQIATLEADRRSLEADRSRLQTAREGILSGQLSARGFQEAIGSGGSSGGTGGGMEIAGRGQGQLEELTKLDQQIADARSRYASNSPMLLGLEARRQALLPLLRRDQLNAVDAALNLHAARIRNARNQQSLLDAQFLRQPELIKEYDGLQQRLLIAQNNLTGLTQARENFQLEIAQRTEPWSVMADPRVNPTPVLPSLPRNLSLGLLLGLAAGAGAGLLRDRLDHVFHSPSDVTEELHQPLLGHIPHVAFFKGVREDKRFLIEELDRSVTDSTDSGLSGYQRFFYQEAFRNLFTSLRFLNSGQPLRSVALTSSIPAEGKSLINVLLAKTLCEMGQRVLLVDADLRKPQMHHRLGVNNLTGLSNLLTEDDVHWPDVVQPVAGYNGWSVLTAGRRPPDPARLLSSSRMHSLVRELAASGQFDLIIYDTPPVLGLADAALVAEHLDGLMLLVSLDRVDRALPKEAIARIRSSGAALLGLVTNAVKEEKSSSSAYGYGYGRYGYGGYGYGAYDPRTTYAYYQDGDKPAAAPQTNRFRQWREKLVKWIDA